MAKRRGVRPGFRKRTLYGSRVFCSSDDDDVGMEKNARLDREGVQRGKGAREGRSRVAARNIGVAAWMNDQVVCD